jgi:gluconate 5-dehydrogenase
MAAVQSVIALSDLDNRASELSGGVGSRLPVLLMTREIFVIAKNLFDLSGRTALITGSSQGIGLVIAEALATYGATIVLNGRDEERLNVAATTLRHAGHTVGCASFDVTDADAAVQAVKHVEEQFGPIDILVNNAGMQFREALENFPIEKWDQIFRTNVASAFYVSQPVAKSMIARGRGKIINIASVQSELARPGIAPYTATKGALKNLTKGMCTDWARHGLQINAIAPGYFRTPLNQALTEDSQFCEWLAKRTPAGRWGEVPELAGAAVYLASEASSFVNGHTLYVDGGITVSL